MATYYNPFDIKPDLLMGQCIAMIGYGNQGRPQALNLRDSGFEVVVGLYEGSAKWATAEEEGFVVRPVAEAASEASFVMLCLPDQIMAEVYRNDVEANLKPSATLAFCHGFNIRFGFIQPRADLDVVLISPKGAGTGVRKLYEAGSGVPALIGVHQDATGQALARALAYGWGIGSARAFMMATTFAEETETDLFGEQAVLCGGIPELIKAGFETLIEAGYAPEIAYFETLHETKLIIDLIVERGLTGMRAAISDTAEWGGFQVGERLITEETRIEMRRVLSEIQVGAFANEWINEACVGSPTLNAFRTREADLDIERVGREVRERLRGGN